MVGLIYQEIAILGKTLPKDLLELQVKFNFSFLLLDSTRTTTLVSNSKVQTMKEIHGQQYLLAHLKLNKLGIITNLMKAKKQDSTDIDSLEQNNLLVLLVKLSLLDIKLHVIQLMTQSKNALFTIPHQRLMIPSHARFK
jgi:hypothetical protein